MSAKKKIMIRESPYSHNSAKAKHILYAQVDDMFFNIWLSKYDFDGLSRDQREFYMRMLWSTGRVAVFPIIKPGEAFMGQKPDDYQDGLIGLAPYAPQAYNMFNFPTMVQLINQRGVPYIPSELQVVGRDCVIGFALHSRQPVRELLAPYIDKIVAVEMVIRTNLTTSKKGVLLTCAPEDADALNDILRQWDWDEPFIRTRVKNPNGFTSQQISSEYIIDKLYQYRTQLFNEALTVLGIKNSGSIIKKAHLLMDEVNATDALTTDFSDGIDQCIYETWDEVDSLFGYKVKITNKTSPRADLLQDTGKEGEQNDDGSILPNA